MTRKAIAQHEVGNTVVMSGKRGEPNRETAVLGAGMVAVGAKTGGQAIKTDADTGLKYQTDEIAAKVIYKLSEQKRPTWFVLDLETGGRGWYPGCVTWGSVHAANIKEYDDDLSKTLLSVADTDVQILDALDSLPRQWYHVRHNDVVGYVRKSAVERISYKNPN